MQSSVPTCSPHWYFNLVIDGALLKYKTQSTNQNESSELHHSRLSLNTVWKAFTAASPSSSMARSRSRRCGSAPSNSSRNTWSMKGEICRPVAGFDPIPFDLI